HPQWNISLEIEPETWDSVRLLTPNDYARFKTLATSSRIEFINPAYAQPYCYNISGESIIRHFIYGIRKLKSHFPDVQLTTYAVEEPCFTSCLPQILGLLDYKYASLKCPNTCWGGYAAPYGGELVDWIAPDGSSILTSPRYACESLINNSVSRTTAWGNPPEYIEACRQAGINHPVGMCLQDAGWRNGPWIGSGDKVRGNSRYVTWRGYFEEFGSSGAKERYQFSQEDVRVALMWGSQVLQRIAQQVRHSEDLLPQAEKLATQAYITHKFDYPYAEMDEAWRTLLLAQHHDSWIVPYNGLHEKGSWAQHIAQWTAATNGKCRQLINDAQTQMGGIELSDSKRATLRVYNTLGFARREVVEILLPEMWQNTMVSLFDLDGHPVETSRSGRGLLFEADVPAFGYTTYRLKRKGAIRVQQQGQTDSYTIENDRYRISVDPQRGGVIKELKVKEAGGSYEYVDLTSDYGMGELRGYFYDQGAFRSSMQSPAVVSSGACGELEKWLLVEGEIASHPFTQRIVLRKDAPEIDVELTIDWQHNEGIGEFRQHNAYSSNRRACYDDRFKLSLLFPTTLNAPTLDKDAPFDVCRSKLVDTHFNSWDSIKHNIILHWVDLAEPRCNGRGLALLTDHTTSYRHGVKEPLGLTVQYAGAGLWGCDYPIDSITRIRYALVPHKGTWDGAGIDRINAKRSEPLLTSLHLSAPMESRSFIDLRASGYELVAAYPVKGGFVVRLFNASGADTPEKIYFDSLLLGNIEEIDLNNKKLRTYPITRELEGSSITLSMPRFGLKTLQIHDNL
ncbi:MAG: glycoside hydrolase family 38 C-terminal domain-containing protein, partial [Alistipes sp.]